MGEFQFEVRMNSEGKTLEVNTLCLIFTELDTKYQTKQIDKQMILEHFSELTSLFWDTL